MSRSKRKIETQCPPAFPELEQIQQLIATSGDLVRSRVLARVKIPGGERLPIIGLAIGSNDKRHPTLGLFGGIHGLERVGTVTAVAYLASLIQNLRWDKHARKRFKKCRLVAIPLINPGGMLMKKRGNPNGVDLMRNADVQTRHPPPFLIGGHRITPLLWWYRGRANRPMEKEARTVVDFVEKEMFESECALALDFHSGFGIKDRLWYPYAKSRKGFPRLKEALRFARLLERTYPQHLYRYRIEPQAKNYTTHGDLWDYIFDRHWAVHGEQGPVFIPWTLEMGSWRWVQKNPRQILSILGPFNPMVPFRLSRVMRQHLVLTDFFLRAADNPSAWSVF